MSLHTCGSKLCARIIGTGFVKCRPCFARRWDFRLDSNCSHRNQETLSALAR